MHHLRRRRAASLLLLAASSLCYGFITTVPGVPGVAQTGTVGRRCSVERMRRRNGPFSFFRGPQEGPDDKDGKKGGKEGMQKPGSKPVRSGFTNLGPEATKKAPSGAGASKQPLVRPTEPAIEKEGPLEGIKKTFAAVTEKLQTPIPISNLLSKAAYLAVGFLGGAGTGVIYLLSPSGSLPDTIAQPITLFENILLQIDRGYVEKVDDKKLFETAVESMLSTLDPYTEFEGEQLARDMRESVSGRYGGVGLVIAGSRVASPEAAVSDALPPAGEVGDTPVPITQDTNPTPSKDKDGKDKDNKDRGITVVSAFEGYAFDAGMRVGDRLLSVDGVPVQGRSVDQVRDLLRGAPDTSVTVSFERPGAPPDKDSQGITLTLTRRLVRVPDVKLTTFLGPVEDGIGYVQLQGFSQGAPNELRLSLELLRLRSPQGLRGLILDLRNNPGGLLSSAVDVASLLVPQESDIVSAKGRNFPPVSYSSSLPPLRDTNIPLAVLVNGATASAAEIVSGAVQDLDSGVIVGGDRTFGKGLVQNVETLPYNTALKYTVAKYYTPSGRCIQSVRYTSPKEGKRADDLLKGSLAGSGYEASKIPDSERKEFRTKNGRVVRDGGGIEADVKISAPQSSILEVTLLQQGAFFDYAGEWAKTHRYSGQGIHKSDDFINDGVYEDFKKFVYKQADKGALKLDLLFSGSLEPLELALKETGYKQTRTDLDALRKALRTEVEAEFSSKKEQIKEQVQEAILARYLPESMLRRIALDRDPQVKVAIETIKDRSKYMSILHAPETALADGPSDSTDGLATTGGSGKGEGAAAKAKKIRAAL